MKKILLSALSLIALAPAAFAEQTDPWAMEGKWMVRARAIGIVPDESSTISVIGGKADFSNEIVPEVDFTYFFTNNIAAELILATAKHDATAKNTILGNVDAGSAWVLPPTLTLQYHFTQIEGFKPYLGAGINYTMYYSEDAGSQTSLKLDDNLGFALQAGVDIPIDDKWAWNFDVKKIYVDADGSWNGGAIRGNIELDPWVFGTGISYRF